MAGTKRKSTKTASPSTKRLRSAAKDASTGEEHKINGVAAFGKNTNEPLKKQILLNAFDMSTVGHLSPGQWKVRTSNCLLMGIH